MSAGRYFEFSRCVHEVGLEGLGACDVGYVVVSGVGE